jgi:hypothetical protein
MAYEDDYDGATSQTNYGLASNPLMPLGDPMAYARTGSAPEMAPGIHVPGAALGKIAQAQPINMNVMPARGGGAESPVNALQGQEAPAAGPDLNSLSGLLQMKGLADLSGMSTPGVGSALPTPLGTPAPGDVSVGRPHSQRPTGVSFNNAGPYTGAINAAADKWGVDPGMQTRMHYIESGFDPGIVNPQSKATGIGQFLPGTAKRYGIDPTNAGQSIDASAHYISDNKKLFGGNEGLAYAGYNWGEGNVQKWLNGNGPAPPKSTFDYVKSITGQPLVKPSANVPSAAAAPMAAMVTAGGGGFAAPPGATPRVGQMSPQGGPYVLSGGKLYPTDRDGKIIPGKQPFQGSTSSQGGGYPKVVASSVPGPSIGVPKAVEPEQDQGQTQAPSASGSDLNMQRLWKYMLIKSLMPQLQFRNINYDPWAVHRFGQSGGY